MGKICSVERTTLQLMSPKERYTERLINFDVLYLSEKLILTNIAIVGPMMTFSVRSSKSWDLQHYGRTICSKNKLDGHRPKDWLFLFIKNFFFNVGPSLEDIFSGHSFFKHIFEHINCPLWVYIVILINVGPRNKK